MWWHDGASIFVSRMSSTSSSSLRLTTYWRHRSSSVWKAPGLNLRSGGGGWLIGNVLSVRVLPTRTSTGRLWRSDACRGRAWSAGSDTSRVGPAHGGRGPRWCNSVSRSRSSAISVDRCPRSRSARPILRHPCPWGLRVRRYGPSDSVPGTADAEGFTRPGHRIPPPHDARGTTPGAAWPLCQRPAVRDAEGSCGPADASLHASLRI